MKKYVISMDELVKFSTNSFETAQKVYQTLRKQNPKSNVVFHF